MDDFIVKAKPGKVDSVVREQLTKQYRVLGICSFAVSKKLYIRIGSESASRILELRQLRRRGIPPARLLKLA